MSETMTAYFVSRTGHVLGAVTRAAGAIPPVPRAASLEDVLVRGGFKNPSPLDPSFPGFLMPARELSTLVFAPDLRLVPDPLEFQVLAQIDAVQHLALDVRSISLALTSGPTKVTVQVDHEVPQEEPVWVLITGGTLTEPRIGAGIIPGSTNTGALDVAALSPGTYSVLALVRDHVPFAAKISIP